MKNREEVMEPQETEMVGMVETLTNNGPLKKAFTEGFQSLLPKTRETLNSQTLSISRIWELLPLKKAVHSEKNSAAWRAAETKECTG